MLGYIETFGLEHEILINKPIQLVPESLHVNRRMSTLKCSSALGMCVQIHVSANFAPQYESVSL